MNNQKEKTRCHSNCLWQYQHPNICNFGQVRIPCTPDNQCHYYQYGQGRKPQTQKFPRLAESEILKFPKTSSKPPKFAQDTLCDVLPPLNERK